MVKRINHNNLLPWFTEDHGRLPATYYRATKKFFDDLSSKHQAASHKQQATSSKRQAATETNKKRYLNYNHENK